VPVELAIGALANADHLLVPSFYLAPHTQFS